MSDLQGNATDEEERGYEWGLAAGQDRIKELEAAHCKAMERAMADVVRVQAEAAKLREVVRMCMAIANNVIYLDDNSDYRDGLREIAHEAGMMNDEIGRAYIQTQKGGDQ